MLLWVVVSAALAAPKSHLRLGLEAPLVEGQEIEWTEDTFNQTWTTHDKRYGLPAASPKLVAAYGWTAKDEVVVRVAAATRERDTDGDLETKTEDLHLGAGYQRSFGLGPAWGFAGAGLAMETWTTTWDAVSYDGNLLAVEAEAGLRKGIGKVGVLEAGGRVQKSLDGEQTGSVWSLSSTLDLDSLQGELFVGVSLYL